ncbi:MAG: hypothetical protein ACOC02_01655 [Guyparkeria sp.]
MPYRSARLDHERLARPERYRIRADLPQNVCAVAAEVFGVDNDTLFEGLERTGDGFVAMIGWQSQGYHPVTMF